MIHTSRILIVDDDPFNVDYLEQELEDLGYTTVPLNPRELRARIQTTLKLKQTIDRKIYELGRVRDLLANYVPETVKRLVAANPEAPELAKREQDVSVLFLDVSGYARLSAQLPPEALNGLVERYFSTFLDQIHEAGGDINETAGDGFMAIFQDGDGRTHTETAVDTALALLDATEALNAATDTRPLSIHMGLNSGLALVGSTRFEGVRGTRWTFTASGPVTNLAARLAATAEAGQLLVGSETARRLGDGYRMERRGRACLKNFAEAVEIYRFLGPFIATY